LFRLIFATAEISSGTQRGWSQKPFVNLSLAEIILVVQLELL